VANTYSIVWKGINESQKWLLEFFNDRLQNEFILIMHISVGVKLMNC